MSVSLADFEENPLSQFRKVGNDSEQMDKQHQEVYEKIWFQLNHELCLNQYLDSLETVFKEKVEAWKNDKQDAQTAKKGVMKRLCAEAEKANGFAQEARIYGTRGNGFLSNLRARRPFIDYNGATEHGDYTHRLQWYIVCEFILSRSADNAKYYAGCADWKCTVDPGHGQPSKTFYLWDFLVDAGGNTVPLPPGVKIWGGNPVTFWNLCRNVKRPFLSWFCMKHQEKMELYTNKAVKDVELWRLDKFFMMGKEDKSKKWSENEIKQQLSSTKSEEKRVSMAKLILQYDGLNHGCLARVAKHFFKKSSVKDLTIGQMKDLIFFLSDGGVIFVPGD
jgi:hypothetical protein